MEGKNNGVSEEAEEVSAIWDGSGGGPMRTSRSRGGCMDWVIVAEEVVLAREARLIDHVGKVGVRLRESEQCASALRGR